MTREEFIELAKSYDYDDDGIADLLETFDEMQAITGNAKYEDIILIPQAVY